MKTLITADDIKKYCDIPDKKLVVTPQTIITPAARDAARDCGLTIVVTDQEAATTPSGSSAAAMPGPSAVPAAAINPDLVAQIVQEVLTAMRLGKDSSDAAKIADPSGLCVVRSDRMVLEPYSSGYPQDKIKKKEFFTAAESPHMTAGFLSLEDTSFTCTPVCEEIAYILDGSVECVVSGRKYTGRTGDTLYLPANKKITLSTGGKAKLFYVTHPAKRPE